MSEDMVKKRDCPVWCGQASENGRECGGNFVFQNSPLIMTTKRYTWLFIHPIFLPHNYHGVKVH